MLLPMGRDDPLVSVINGQILGADPGLARSPRSVTDHWGRHPFFV